MDSEEERKIKLHVAIRRKMAWLSERQLERLWKSIGIIAEEVGDSPLPVPGGDSKST